MEKTEYHIRTWYGATGRIELQGRFWHLAGLGGVEIPHPPVVNLLIRQGLPVEAQRELSFRHELGHLQVLPLAVLAAFALLAQAKQAGRLTWSQGVWLWAEHHALWEMMAESYVMWRLGGRYKRLYGGRLHGGLLIFWLGTAALVAWGFIKPKNA